jgi:hypothetical protein
MMAVVGKAQNLMKNWGQNKKAKIVIVSESVNIRK